MDHLKIPHQLHAYHYVLIASICNRETRATQPLRGRSLQHETFVQDISHSVSVFAPFYKICTSMFELLSTARVKLPQSDTNNNCQGHGFAVFYQMTQELAACA